MAVELNEFIPSILAKPKTVITDPEKFAHEFTVTRSQDGYVFYVVQVSKGSVPKELSGNYSTMDHAVKAVLKYVELAPVSKTVRRDKNTKVREERKAVA